MVDRTVKVLAISSLMLLAELTVAGPALCQPSAKPAVFQAAVTREESPNGLVALVDAFQAYDDNILAGATGAGTERPTVGQNVNGLYSGVGITAQYQTGSDRSVFKSWVNSAIRHYPDLNGATSAFHQVGAMISRPLGRRLVVRLSPYAADLPHYSLQMFPRARGDAGTTRGLFALNPSDVDFGVIERKNVRYGGSAAVSATLSPRSSMSFNYAYGKTHFDEGWEDLEVQTTGIGYLRRFSRNASLRLGYERQRGDYHLGTRRLIENLIIGVDYLKPLSRSRRTYARFSSGSAVIDDGSGRRMQVTGSASLVHQIGRTWLARADYERGARYLDGFAGPILADSASGTLTGLFTRRLELTLDAGYFSGIFGYRSDSPPFDTFATMARLRTAFSRSLAAYLEYRSFHYRFDQDTARPIGLPRNFDRRGARIGLSYFVPLMK